MVKGKGSGVNMNLPASQQTNKSEDSKYMREAGRGKNVGRERMGKTEDEEECG